MAQKDKGPEHTVPWAFHSRERRVEYSANPRPAALT